MKLSELFVLAALLLTGGYLAFLLLDRSQPNSGTATKPPQTFPEPEISSTGPMGQKGGLGVSDAAFSPDGKLLLVGYHDGFHASATYWKSLALFDVQTGKAVRSWIGHQRQIKRVYFLPHGKQMFTIDTERNAKLWDVASGLEIPTGINEPGGVNEVAFSPDGKFVLYVSYQNTERGRLTLREFPSWKLVREFDDDWGTSLRRSISFSPDGCLALTGAYGRPGWNVVIAAHLWDVATGKIVCSLRVDEGWWYLGGFSPDGKSALAGRIVNEHDEYPTLVLWDVATGGEIRSLAAGQSEAGGRAPFMFSPDGSRLLYEGTIEPGRYALIVWDIMNRKMLHRFPLEWHAIISFSPDSKLAFGTRGRYTDGFPPTVPYSRDLTLELLDTETGKVIRALDWNPRPAK